MRASEKSTSISPRRCNGNSWSTGRLPHRASELATAHSGDLAVVSLCSSTPPFFLYIQIDEERLFSAAELGGDVVAFKTQFGGLVAEDGVWIVGLLVIEDSQEGPRSQRRRHLSRSGVRACAPAKLTRRVIRGGTHAVPPSGIANHACAS